MVLYLGTLFRTGNRETVKQFYDCGDVVEICWWRQKFKCMLVKLPIHNFIQIHQHSLHQQCWSKTQVFRQHHESTLRQPYKIIDEQNNFLNQYCFRQWIFSRLGTFFIRNWPVHTRMFQYLDQTSENDLKNFKILKWFQLRTLNDNFWSILNSNIPIMDVLWC